MKILTESTSTALWYQMLQEAQSKCQIILSSDIESYLILMLTRYLTYTTLAQEMMASTFLKGIQLPTRLRATVLQDIGDRCLLISGLFPFVAEKRLVKLRYYIDIGQIAYEVISQKNNDIFSSLSKQFIPLMDVLQSFRPSTFEPLPLEISQIWENSSPLKKSKK